MLIVRSHLIREGYSLINDVLESHNKNEIFDNKYIYFLEN